MRRLIMLCIVFTACHGNVMGGDDDCPAPSVQVPQNLAREIARRMVREETPEEQEQLLAEAENRKGGISSLFCAKAIDLDKDGKRDLLIQFLYSAELPGCGTVNCSVWAYRRTDNGYKLLLEAWGVGHISVLKASTNGYLDLKTAARESAVTYVLITYKFDGRQYQARVCMTETAVGDNPGKGRWKRKRYRCPSPVNGRVTESVYSSEGFSASEYLAQASPVKAVPTGLLRIMHRQY